MSELECTDFEPFIGAFYESMATISTIPFTKGAVIRNAVRHERYDKCAAIQVGGFIEVSMVIRMPDTAITNVFAYFTGMTEADQGSLLDTIGEIVNIVSGSAQRHVTHPSQRITLGLPQVFGQHQEPSFTDISSPDIMTYEFLSDDGLHGPIYLDILRAKLNE